MSEVTVEVAGRQVRVSNPDKVLFPTSGTTKLELVEHYVACTELMLPHVGDRPVTMRRYPEGVDHDGWFQKHAPSHLPQWVRTATVPRGDRGHRIEHVVADSAPALAYLANLAAIELHVGPAPVRSPDEPVELVLDLDPPPGAGPSVARRATRRCRELLEDLGVPSALKTSGSAGFHVHVFLATGASQALARDVSRGLAAILARRHPDELTIEHRKSRRGDRVLVDWFRNAPGQTYVAPYSVRARGNAPVATPMDWGELAGTDPQRWTITSLRRRLAQRAAPWSSPVRVDPRALADDVARALGSGRHHRPTTS